MATFFFFNYQSIKVTPPPSWNEPKSSLFERRAPSAGRRAPSAERREKLSKQTAPRKSEKKFSRTNSITDPECNLIIVKFYRRGKAF